MTLWKKTSAGMTAPLETTTSTSCTLTTDICSNNTLCLLQPGFLKEAPELDMSVQAGSSSQNGPPAPQKGPGDCPMGWSYAEYYVHARVDVKTSGEIGPFMRTSGTDMRIIGPTPMKNSTHTMSRLGGGPGTITLTR